MTNHVLKFGGCISVKPIDYVDADGTLYSGYIARPDNPTGAGILIAHNFPGVGEHERRVAEKLADLGYVVVAADYHGGGRMLHADELKVLSAKHTEDPTALRTTMSAALETLQNQPDVDSTRIAVIGYCFGGLAALELGKTGADLAAIAGFHTPLPVGGADDVKNIKGKVLIMNAANDPYVSMESRAAFEKQMSAAGIDWRMVLFGSTDHGFTVHRGELAEKFAMPNISYSKRSDTRSWKMMLDLFAETVDARNAAT